MSESMDARGDAQGGMDSSGEGLVERVKDKATDIVGEVEDRAGDLVDSARLRTGNLQARLSDALDSGARAIRERTGGAAEQEGGTSSASRSKLAKAGAPVADTLERTAMWLRENDLSDVGTIVRQQLRDHPGRTALVALAAGVVIGRASRRS